MPRSRKRSHHHHTWTPAGTLCVDPNAPKPEVDVMAYGPDELFEAKLDDLRWVEDHKDKYPVLWINVDGLGDSFVVGELGRIFNLHKLALEDVVHGNQRPKVDIYEGHLFISLRMLYRNEGRVETEQLSIFLGKGFIISFQEGIPGDCFNPVRERLRKEGTRLRAAHPDFLAYSLLDSVIDAYFPYLEDLGEQLEHLEDKVMTEPSREVIQEIHMVKRDLLVVRRAVWPLREAINPLLREDTPLVAHETRVFLRDAYDHCIQVVDLIETYRDLGSSLMDIYLSSISNKMNEVMKVLTIITTIFVPLTFVAGVYGMNFNTEKSPLNMPELNSYYGYPMCWAVMLAIAGVEIYYFWRKGWIWEKKHPPKPPPPQITGPSVVK